MNQQADAAAGEPFENESDYGYDYESDYGYGESRDDDPAEVSEIEDDTSADSEYVDPCEPDERESYDGWNEMPGGETDWGEDAAAESVVWGMIVSWASRSLEGLGDALHSLSRGISGLNGKSLTVGSRQDRSVR